MSDNTNTPPTGETSRFWELLNQETYTPQQAAEVLNISENAILRDAYGGDLKALIINGDVVSISRTALVAWLQWRESR